MKNGMVGGNRLQREPGVESNENAYIHAWKKI